MTIQVRFSLAFYFCSIFRFNTWHIFDKNMNDFRILINVTNSVTQHTFQRRFTKLCNTFNFMLLSKGEKFAKSPATESTVLRFIIGFFFFFFFLGLLIS